MPKILIVGGVAGGASAAARARRLSETAEIVMFERGPYVSFANCGLPYHIGGEIEERSKLLLQTPDSFLQRFNVDAMSMQCRCNVDVRVMQEVSAINRSEKTVTVSNLIDGTDYTESYDFLLLSPGASPVVPPIEGIANPLTYSLRNIPDMDAILNVIGKNCPKHATVVGGGFIGLEMMEAFHRLGITTTLLELSDQVMAPVDREMACIVHEEIRQKGIDLRLETGLTAVQFNEYEKSLTLTLSNGELINTGLLIMAIGVRPQTALAKQAGLDIGELGGIVTNSAMQTSDPAIYAVGDAIEELDFVTGKPTVVPLAGPANRQGRMAADNMLGRNEHYQGTQGTAICKVFELAVAT